MKEDDNPKDNKEDISSNKIIENAIEKSFGKWKPLGDWEPQSYEEWFDLREVEIELSEEIGELRNLNNDGDYRSIVFLEYGDEDELPNSVVKTYLKTRHNFRKNASMKSWNKSNNPVLNSVKAHKENKSLFPTTSKVGEGNLTAGDFDFDIQIIRQDYIPEAKNKTIERSIKDRDLDRTTKNRIDEVIKKWKGMVESNRSKVDHELEGLTEEAKKGNLLSFKTLQEKYHDRFPGLMADLPLKKVKERYPSLKNYELPEVSFESSKIVGDFAHRQLLWGKDEYLTFDTEKYGTGEPERDLSLMIEELINEEEPNFKRGEEVLSQISDSIEHEELVPRMERSAVGYEAERVMNSYTERQRSFYKGLLELNIKFYRDLEI